MFRALLWKEWRELWVLPVAAAPLSAMTFYLTKMAVRQPAPYAWNSSFALWLIVAAIYIPTHLYVREEETDTIDFLMSKPLDRFRVWWLWLFVGVAALAAIGVVLFVVTDLLSRLYFENSIYERYRAGIVTTSFAASLIAFSMSTLMSALFKRQLSAIAAVILVFSLVPACWAISRYWPSEMASIINFYPNGGFRLMGKYYSSGMAGFSLVFPLIACPILLFSSLAIFAKGSVWRSSRMAIAQAYGLSGFIALMPMVMGFSHLSYGNPHVHRGGYSGLGGVRVSEDGSRVSIYAGGKWAALDLSSKKLIDSVPDRFYKYNRPVAGGETLEFRRHAGTDHHNYQIRVTIWDSLKSWKRRLTGGEWRQRYYPNFHTSWSVDGKFVAVFERPSEKMGEDGFLAIMDRDGNVLGEKLFPLLQGDLISPIGWDHDSRFYFAQTTKPRNPRTTCHRITPVDMTSEEVAGLSLENCSFDSMSPDGRWVLIERRSGNASERGHWVYDISKERLQFVGTDLRGGTRPPDGAIWSPDGSMLAYTAPVPRRSDTKQPSRNLRRPMIYRPAIGESFPFSEAAFHEPEIYGWSPSGKHLLGSYSTIEKDTDAKGNLIGGRWYKKHLVALSVETLRTIEIDDPLDRPYRTYISGRSNPAWILGDRLLWKDKNKLIATEKDGSNPQEIFRIEGGKFYLYGEEQT